jgi:hypothetical protein
MGRHCSQYRAGSIGEPPSPPVPDSAVLTYEDGFATVTWGGTHPPSTTVDGLLLYWGGSSWYPQGVFPTTNWIDGQSQTEVTLGAGRYYARLSLNSGESYIDSPEIVVP